MEVVVKRLLLVCAVMFACVSMAQAQDQPPAQRNEMSGMGPGGEKKGGMMGKEMMHGMMMQASMPKQIVASGDGGVFVLVGNKIVKYDKNLAVVKEATVKVDTESMKKMMADMKGKCPMMAHEEKNEKPGEAEEPGDDMPMPAK
jgi:hypothetical protein